MDTECTPTLLDVQALGKVPGDYSKGFMYLSYVTRPLAMQLIAVKQILVRKVMPRQEGTSWKVMGSNPYLGNGFLLIKSLLK